MTTQANSNTETNDRAARRAKMMDKLRKLLAMAKDGRGSSNEEATALRQANKIMAEYGIAEAEVDMKEMDAGRMEFGEVHVGMDGRAPEPGSIFRDYLKWVGVISIGVARFTDTIAERRTTEAGEILVFRGERHDCLMARWLTGVLVQSTRREQIASGWNKNNREANEFCHATAGRLQQRLYTAADERRRMFEQSTSMALAVVDRKAGAIAKFFGEQKTSTKGNRIPITGATIAGAKAGDRINIPMGRPLEGKAQAAIR